MQISFVRLQRPGCLFATVVVLLVCSTAAAQVETATLTVHTTAGDEQPLPGVAVFAINTDTGLRRESETDAMGTARLLALPPGSYRVEANLQDFESGLDPGYVLRVGQNAYLRFTMRPIITDVVSVSGDLPLVDVYKLDSSTNIVPEQVRALPVPDRQVEHLAFLAPGVQRDRSDFLLKQGKPVIGSGGNSTTAGVLIDGADLFDPYFGFSRVRLSPDAIREFRVVGRGFDTEIGGSSAGVLSLVTKTGTNTLHGSVYGYYRSDALRATGALELEDTDYSRTHFGFTLGGPITRDTTHYFASLEHMDENDIALFRPGGAFVGAAEDVPVPTVETLGLLSLDHFFSISASGMVRLMVQHVRRGHYRAGGVIDKSHSWDLDRKNWNLLAGHTLVIDDRRLNDLRIQAGTSHLDTFLNSEELSEWFSSGNTLRTGAHWDGSGFERRRTFDVRDTFHWQLTNRHLLKAGISYSRIEDDYREERYELGWTVYATDTRDLPYLYNFGVGSSRIDYGTNIVGVFIQDDWQPRPNVTLGFGLRYDVDTDANNPRLNHPLVEGRGIDSDNLQPRFGFSWDIGSDGRSVLRGGVGRFVSRYVLMPTLWERQFNGETGRLTARNLNGWFLGLPPDSWLDADDPSNTGIPLAPDISLLSNSFQAPESIQAGIGFTQRLGDGRLFFDAEVVVIDGDNETVVRDTNWRGNDDPGTINPDYTTILSYTEEGHSRYRAFILSLNGTIGADHIITASLTVADKKNIMDDAVGINFPSDSADIEGEWGPSQTNERYRLVLSGVFHLPWRLTLAPYYEYGSGQPWNRLLGFDANGDFWPSDRPPGVGRNDMDGPRYHQLNLRLVKTFSIGGRGSLETILDVFNVLNTVNYDVRSVDNAMFYLDTTTLSPTPNPRFGQYTATLPPLEIQLGLRYSF